MPSVVHNANLLRSKMNYDDNYGERLRKPETLVVPRSTVLAVPRVLLTCTGLSNNSINIIRCKEGTYPL